METTVNDDNNSSKDMSWRVAISILTFFGFIIDIILWKFSTSRISTYIRMSEALLLFFLASSL